MLDTRNEDTKSIRIADTFRVRNADTFCVRIADTESVRNGISALVLPELRLLLCR